MLALLDFEVLLDAPDLFFQWLRRHVRPHIVTQMGYHTPLGWDVRIAFDGEAAAALFLARWSADLRARQLPRRLAALRQRSQISATAQIVRLFEPPRPGLGLILAPGFTGTIAPRGIVAGPRGASIYRAADEPIIIASAALAQEWFAPGDTVQILLPDLADKDPASPESRSV